MRLRDTQSTALERAAKAGCLFAQVGVGHGKTLICALLPEALRAKRPLLLLPGATREGTMRLRSEYGTLPPCEVWTYERLSHRKHRHDLLEYKPDGIICDEAHRASGEGAAARRIAEYLRGAQGTRVCALSGTLLRAPIERACRAAAWVFRGASPLPVKRHDILRLGAVISGKETSIVERAKWHRRFGRDILAGIREAVDRAPGGFVAGGLSCDSALVIERAHHELPRAVRDALRTLEGTWELDGLCLTDAMRVADTRRQLACGFYYRWAAPANGGWLEARRAWGAAVRAYLSRPRAYDSEGTILAALQRGERPSAELAEAWRLWRLWRAVPTPPTEAVWLDDGLLRQASAMAMARDGLLWCAHRAEAERAEAFGLRAVAPEHDPKGGACAVSIAAHGTGRNLQHYSDSVFLAPLLDATAWEQVLGRTHRQGQEADEVRALVYVSTANAEDLERAIDGAHKAEKLTDTPQRLLLGLQ